VHAQRAGRADGGVLQISLLQINCSAPARKLKLDKSEQIKIFARKLENEERGKNFQKLSCRTHQYLQGA